MRIHGAATDDVVACLRISRTSSPDQRSDWTTSESINTPRFYEMTNETTLHENGAADPAAIAALTAADTSSSTETAAAADAAPTEPKPPSFADFDLHQDIRQALDEMGYFLPTAVQTAVYGPVHAGKDLLVQSRTGTGKTTAFGLPILSKIVPTARQPQALILAPTRELALQVSRELTNIGKHRGLVIEAIYGGAPIGKQITNLRNGVHVIVGTPGRVLDHIGRGTLDTKAINTFVLDECDEMLSMGFLEDIERVVKHLPEKKQTLLFSATMPDEVTRYSRRHMVAPEQISLSRDSMTVTDIHHAYYIVSGIARSRDLLKILYAEEPESAIIFCNMRDETTAVARFLQKQGLDAEPLSSDLSQSDRERVMGKMKAKTLRYLCATDVAARGIDISSLSHVINYSVPESPEVYVHRTGRTGRAGKKGVALSMVGPRELGNFRYVRLTFGLKPEERLLPKDAIFEGKIKVPLPPIGLPKPPDPVQILIRGVTNVATDLETKIFEKLYSTAGGKKVLAALVAEKLDKLSTRSKPKREHTERAEHRTDGETGGADRPPRSFDRDGGGDRPRFNRDDRGPRPEGDRGPRPEGDRGPRPEGDRGPRRFDRDDRGPRRDDGDRPRRFDRDDRGPRRFDRDDRGPRPEGGAPADGAPRPDGAPVRAEGEAGAEQRPDRGPRPEGDRGDRERRPWRDRDGGGGGDDRPRRFDRDRDRGGRDRNDRNERQDRPHTDVIVPASPDVLASPTTVPDSTAPEAGIEVRSESTDTTERSADRGNGGDRERRPWRDRDDRGRGDRGGRDRGGRDRDRGGDRDRTRDAAPEPARNETLPLVTEAPPEVAPVVEPEVAKVDDVARAAPDRGDKKGSKRGAKSEPTAETREFWETWAEEKSTRPATEQPPAKAVDAESPDEPRGEPAERSARGRDRGGRGRDKDRGRGDKRGAKAETTEKSDDKRGKRESAAPAAAAASTDAAQARLFVSLGKKHGVSADDLRALLAAGTGGDKAKIGAISLRDSHAHVRVPEDAVDAIIAAVNGTQHNEQDVTVERARA